MAKHSKQTKQKRGEKMEPRRVVVGLLAAVLALLMLVPIFSMIVGNVAR